MYLHTTGSAAWEPDVFVSKDLTAIPSPSLGGKPRSPAKGEREEKKKRKKRKVGGAKKWSVCMSVCVWLEEREREEEGG